MKVVVTGGSGQLGSLVLRRLIDDSAITHVVSVDLRPPLFVSEKLTAIEADVRDTTIGEHFAKADALMHFAFVVVKHVSPEEARSINVDGSRNVFEIAARAGMRRIVYSSSIAAYGVVPGHPNPITETSTRVHQPEFTYAATKYEVEDLLDAFERSHPEISVARLRPSILVGSHMEHALGNMLRHGFLPDTGEEPFPIVWDEDVADAALLALARAAHGPFNLSADEPLPTRQLAQATGLHVLRSTAQTRKAMAQAMEHLAKWGLWSGIDPAWLSAKAPMFISSERARQELGWQPRCPTALSVMQHQLETVPRRLDPRIALFFHALRLVPLGVEVPPLRIRLVLTGEGGGELGLTVENGHVETHSEPPRPPTSVVTMRAAMLRDLLTGKTDLDNTQRTDGLRVEGEIAALTVIGEIIEMLRAGTRSNGARRVVARAVSKIIEG